MSHPSPFDTSHLQSVLRTLDRPGSLGSEPLARDLPGEFADRALARAAGRRRRHSALAVAGAAVAAAVVALTVVLVPGNQNQAAPATTSTTGVFAQPRQNVLLLGTDAGPGREGIRPDTIILASIDTRTGATVMTGLPRNLERAPFPPGTPGAAAFPNGFYCAQDACLLNAVWEWAATTGASYYRGAANPGLLATIQVVEGVTGLKVDQAVVVSMKGLQDLVDAAGGVDIAVRKRLPIGGNSENHKASGWLEPGKQHLDGYQALWYVRSRWSTNDFDRMSRAQCLISGLVQQADVGTLVRNYPKLAAALRSGLQTSFPADDLEQWGDLVMRMRDGGVVMLPLIPADRSNPDYDVIRATIAAAIARASSGQSGGSAAATPGPDPQPSAVPAVARAC